MIDRKKEIRENWSVITVQSESSYLF